MRLLQKVGLDSVLIVISILLLIKTANISDYLLDKYNIESWKFSLNLTRLCYLLMLYALRIEVKKLIGSMLYRVVVYVLINNFIDRFFGIEGWSWNDYITIMVVVLDFVLQKYIKKWK